MAHHTGPLQRDAESVRVRDRVPQKRVVKQEYATGTVHQTRMMMIQLILAKFTENGLTKCKYIAFA